MSVKGTGRGRYQCQRGKGRRGRDRYGRGYSYSVTTHKHKELWSALGIHVFDHGKKASADQIRTTWEKLVNHVKNINEHYISNKLLNKKTLIIPKPEHTQDTFELTSI